jgi:hypothetical protein
MKPFQPGPQLVHGLALAQACGVAGDKGAAIFHVGSEWTKERPIAVGSIFAASAQKNDLLRTSLTVKSDTPDIVKALQGGSFQTIAEGTARLQAVEPGSQAMVDEVSFTVSKPAAATLAWWADKWLSPLAKVDEKFAVVQGSRLKVDAALLDAQTRPLNHLGIATLTSDHAQITAVGELFDVTPTTLGATSVVLGVKGVDGKEVLNHAYQVTVVQTADVAKLDMAPPVLFGAGTPAPTDPNAPPPAADPKAEVKTRVYLLVTDCKLADGTRVYGAKVEWTESGSGHLALKTTDGTNYVLVKQGEKVKVTATVGTLQKSVDLAP